ncbi:MAG: PH domain-containing protein [Defluviitaleaceae bacterium]|nr:PH domain-containing protein [Defluviitaleaceae bacterium]
MKFKPTLGRWLWFYPAAAGVTLFLMYSWSGGEPSFYITIANLAGVILLIAGVMVYYALLLTSYELGEHEIIIRYGLSGPLKIAYNRIHSVKVKSDDDVPDLLSMLRNAMLLGALEIKYSIGRKTGSVVLISPKDKEVFRRELEMRLRFGDAEDVRSYKYEV